MKKNYVIAVCGLSGVGKSTLIRSVSSRADFLHWTASDLIKAQLNKKAGVENSSEQLRKGDVKSNQTILVDGFKDQAQHHGAVIILDCHTLIDTPTGIEYISSTVFEDIGVSKFLFLWDEPREIKKRREHDVDRVRPICSAEELSDHQSLSLSFTVKIATLLQVPLTLVSDVESGAVEILSSIKFGETSLN